MSSSMTVIVMPSPLDSSSLKVCSVTIGRLMVNVLPFPISEATLILPS